MCLFPVQQNVNANSLKSHDLLGLPTCSAGLNGKVTQQKTDIAHDLYYVYYFS